MSKLFRKDALESLSSPEQLNTLLQVTKPVAWLALLAALVLTLSAVVWGFMGSLAVTVTGPGVLLPEGGLRTVPALTSGVMTEVISRTDQVVMDEAVVARMKPAVVGGEQSNWVEVSADKGGTRPVGPERRVRGARADRRRFGRTGCAYRVPGFLCL